jgi:hypothetical protein
VNRTRSTDDWRTSTEGAEAPALDTTFGHRGEVTTEFGADTGVAHVEFEITGC